MSSRVKDYDLMLWWAEDPKNNLIEEKLDGEKYYYPTAYPTWGKPRSIRRKMTSPRHHHEAMKMFADDSSISAVCFMSSVGAGVSTNMPSWDIGNTYRLIKDGKEIFVSHGVRYD